MKRVPIILCLLAILIICFLAVGLQGCKSTKQAQGAIEIIKGLPREQQEVILDALLMMFGQSDPFFGVYSQWYWASKTIIWAWIFWAGLIFSLTFLVSKKFPISKILLSISVTAALIGAWIGISYIKQKFGGGHVFIGQTILHGLFGCAIANLVYCWIKDKFTKKMPCTNNISG